MGFFFFLNVLVFARLYSLAWPAARALAVRLCDRVLTRDRVLCMRALLLPLLLPLRFPES